jgi:hypothetical protein
MASQSASPMVRDDLIDDIAGEVPKLSDLDEAAPDFFETIWDDPHVTKLPPLMKIPENQFAAIGAIVSSRLVTMSSRHLLMFSTVLATASRLAWATFELTMCSVTRPNHTW